MWLQIAVGGMLLSSFINGRKNAEVESAIAWWNAQGDLQDAFDATFVRMGWLKNGQRVYLSDLKELLDKLDLVSEQELDEQLTATVVLAFRTRTFKKPNIRRMYSVKEAKELDIKRIAEKKQVVKKEESFWGKNFFPIFLVVSFTLMILMVF